MKKWNILCFALVATTVLMACAKSEQTQPQTTDDPALMILGTWTETHRATDNNNNGTMDENEKTATPSTEEYIYKMDEYGGGTAKLKQGALDTTLILKWELRNDNKSLYIAIPALEDSAVNEIISLSDTELIIWDNTDEANKPKEWTVLKKQ